MSEVFASHLSKVIPFAPLQCFDQPAHILLITLDGSIHLKKKSSLFVTGFYPHHKKILFLNLIVTGIGPLLKLFTGIRRLERK